MRTATDTILRHLAMLAAIPVIPDAKSTRDIREELAAENPDYDVTVRSIQRSVVSRTDPLEAQGFVLDCSTTRCATVVG